MGIGSSKLADKLPGRRRRDRRNRARSSRASTPACTACACCAQHHKITTTTTAAPKTPSSHSTSSTTLPPHTSSDDNDDDTDNNNTTPLHPTATNNTTTASISSSHPDRHPHSGNNMSKLSEGLKALINAGHARPGYTKASAQVQPALARFARDAADRHVGLPAWVTVSTAVSATLNCPEAMATILHIANDSSSSSSTAAAARRTPVQNAELIREVGLKCISFNGIPRTINTLGAFHASLPADVTARLNTNPKRTYTPQNLEARQRDGRALWDSVYRGFEHKLVDKLAASHPDLPVHILASHYANLLSDPTATAALASSSEEARRAAGVVDGARVGRVLTSLVAIACLRAQTGVGPQVVSHVFGLRKAYDQRHATDCGARSPGEEEVEGGEWLASDEGNVWLLESVDRLVEAIAGKTGAGTTFAPGMGSKL
ncbi:hypothetical protein MN608_08360 [Microdochium nivale]|nr:hypothetical protein MN608_08360 [Microdochium nivale]